MSEVTKPIALDESFNTTESTPRNIADVLADELVISDLVTQATAIVTKLQALINAVKPDAGDIPLSVPGMSANNVEDGISELKGTLMVKAKEISGTTDAQGRLLSTGFDISSKAVVGVISGGHGQIALQLRLSNNNFAVKFLDSSGMSVIANTSASCIVYYVDKFEVQT